MWKYGRENVSITSVIITRDSQENVPSNKLLHHSLQLQFKYQVSYDQKFNYEESFKYLFNYFYFRL